MSTIHSPSSFSSATDYSFGLHDCNICDARRLRSSEVSLDDFLGSLEKDICVARHSRSSENDPARPGSTAPSDLIDLTQCLNMKTLRRHLRSNRGGFFSLDDLEDVLPKLSTLHQCINPSFASSSATSIPISHASPNFLSCVTYPHNPPYPPPQPGRTTPPGVPSFGTPEAMQMSGLPRRRRRRFRLNGESVSNLPRGIVAMASDGTPVRGRFGTRQSGHGVGAGPHGRRWRGIEGHAFHRAIEDSRGKSVDSEHNAGSAIEPAITSLPPRRVMFPRRDLGSPGPTSIPPYFSPPRGALMSPTPEVRSAAASIRTTWMIEPRPGVMLSGAVHMSVEGPVSGVGNHSPRGARANHVVEEIPSANKKAKPGFWTWVWECCCLDVYEKREREWGHQGVCR